MNKRWIWIGAVVAVLAALGTVGVLALLQNIALRQAEAREVAFRVVEITEDTYESSVWGKNFPRQFDTFMRTEEYGIDTPFGGNVPYEKLDKYPQLRIMWQGFPFELSFREDRGHHWFLYDQRQTRRVHERAQPGSCLHCHSSAVEAYRIAAVQAGLPIEKIHTEEALRKGFDAINAMPWAEADTLVRNPLACIDCHEPQTMRLRITRPSLKDGLVKLANSNAPVPHLPSIERWRAGDRRVPYDVNRLASRHEMRSLTCAQCHVEYYFDRPPVRTLIFPWSQGLKVEQQLQHYDNYGWRDWTHPRAGSGQMKVQHPEFELWSQGPHANVACADCHMPFERVGAVKITNHHARSPLLNIRQSCQNCHNVAEDELKRRVVTIQARTAELEKKAKDAVVELIEAIERAHQAGATDEALNEARTLHRSSQFKVDWIFNENSRGFHAPQESARILAEAMNEARKGILSAHKAEAAAKAAGQ
jgi:nitrite reductase (cytochrome c-552)